MVRTITVSNNHPSVSSNITLLFLSDNVTANDRRLKRKFDLFLPARIAARYLNAAAFVAAVSPPEIRMIAAAVSGTSGIGASLVARGFLLFPPGRT